MWQQIEDNKHKSIMLIFIMLAVLLVLGAAVGVCFLCFVDPPMADSFETLSPQELSAIYESMGFGMFFAFVAWAIMLIVAFCEGKNAVLSLNHANKIPDGANKVLENIVEEMTIASGLPKKPELYIIDSPMPNAFATGMNPENSAIAVTTGLLTTLDRDELQGVVAHEMAHIVNRDTMYMLFAAIMLGTVVWLADFVARALFRSSAGSSRSSSKSSSSSGGGGAAILIIMIVALVIMVIAPIVARILYFSISKKREYLADACAAQFTRYPQGLATALAKISGSPLMDKEADKISSAMYIVNPLSSLDERYDKPAKGRRFVRDGLFSTHPATVNRISVLEAMAGADFNAYNEAFKKVSGRRKPVLAKEELKGTKPLKIKKTADVLAGAVAGAVIASGGVEQKAKSPKEEKRERSREAMDTVWKANNFIFKECSCGTTLKFPQEYKGQEIACPHCKALIKVEE